MLRFFQMLFKMLNNKSQLDFKQNGNHFTITTNAKNNQKCKDSFNMLFNISTRVNWIYLNYPVFHQWLSWLLIHTVKLVQNLR